MGGEITKFVGDNVEAWVDSVEDACKATCAVRTALDNFNKNLEQDFQVRMAACIGYGPTVLLDGDMIGVAHHICHMVAEDEAETGQIVVSKEVKDEMEGKGGYKIDKLVKELQIDGEPVEGYTLELSD